MPSRKSQGPPQGLQIRGFEDLHPKDRQIKQTKKLCIEQHWKCDIKDCLPHAIRPRVELKKGAKNRVEDEDTPYEKWWNWSVELLKSLEELSYMTQGEHELAQDLLEMEVERRQSNPKSSQRKIREILLGDAQKVVDDKRKKAATQYTVEGMEMAGHSRMAQDNQVGFPRTPAGAANGTSTTGHRSAQMTMSSTPIRRNTSVADEREDSEEYYGWTAPSKERDGSPHHQPRASGVRRRAEDPDESVEQLRRQVKISELRARAARLRAQAARVESEALDIEAEAEELREDVQIWEDH